MCSNSDHLLGERHSPHREIGVVDTNEPYKTEVGQEAGNQREHSKSDISEEELIELQSIRSPKSPSTEDKSPSFSSYGLSSLAESSPQSKTVTGLPSSADGSLENLLESDKESHNPTRIAVVDVERTDVTSSPTIVTYTEGLQSPYSYKTGEMGQKQSKKPHRTIPKNIMNEEPQEFVQRQRLVEAEVTGNCRPWSEHVYYKLFLDTEGRLATLMVLKCEITFVDVFTDVEHVLYRSRFIGGKADGVTQLFVFDLMKVAWEDKIPQSQAIELNVDIVISSSPIFTCAEILLNLIKLEKSYLKYRNFDGQLNVTIRFAHALGWDAKDEATRSKIHEGLRNLYKEGINLEVMSADVILDEMRVEDIVISDDERVQHHITMRNAWTIPPMNFKKTSASATPWAKSQSERHYDDSSSEEDFESLDEDDMYHTYDTEENVDGGEGNKVTHEESARDKSDRRSVSIGSSSTIGAGSSRDRDHPEHKMSTMDDGYYVFLHSSLWAILRGTKRRQSKLSESIEAL